MKPDWATRLQRTFARKYDAGFAKGLMLGKAVGARDEQERIVKLLEAISDPAIPMGQLHIPGFQMREIIALIKGEK